MVDKSFRQKVEELMMLVPEGCVTTYGDLAALAGNARASRVVGGLALGFPGGRRLQEELLLGEGIGVTDHIVDNFSEIRWKFNYEIQ
jgi:alkylated DNA nucleotide flippase Atl1